MNLSRVISEMEKVEKSGESRESEELTLEKKFIRVSSRDQGTLYRGV